MLFRLTIAASALGLAAGAAPAAEDAAAAASPLTLFECDLGGSWVRVTADGDRLTYRYGPPEAAELTLTADAAGGKLFYMMQRYAGMEYQLRFADGDTSYIVYTFEGNGHVGAEPSSGLVVMRAGGERVADESCATHAEFSADFDYSTLPEDSEAWSAM